MRAIADCRLYGIVDTGYVDARDTFKMVRLLLDGGVDVIQLRAKACTSAYILEMASQIAPICHRRGVPFILNDHPELVQAAGASGAHVGQDDLSIAEARSLAGPGAIIGKSTHSLDQAIAAAAEIPDYIGFGPLFPTPTKPDYKAIGMTEIDIVQKQVNVPVFCIGGITLSNLPQVLRAGASRVVIVSDLLLAADPRQQASDCKKLLTD
jgi:thiamine-phosphate pyrophosphorylase